MKVLSTFVLILSLHTLAMSPAFASSSLNTPATARQLFKWRPGRIEIAVSSSLSKQNSNILLGSDVAGALKRSFETWQNILGFPLAATTSDKRSISPAGARGDGISLITVAPTEENTLFFSGDLEESAAATRVFYDKRGFVTEADIALNPFQQFSTNGTPGTFDLQATLTHEIGHLLGLEHSDVLGATMHEKYGKNGAYGLANYGARTLSQDDITALQRLYGAVDGGACCQRIEGKLTSTDAKPRNWEVWAEDAQTGQVRSIAASDTDGNFGFGGLSGGSLLLFAQDKNGDEVSQGEIGTVTSTNDVTGISKKVSPVKGDFKLDYLGFNGQLSDIAVALNAGKIYTLYLGGINLDPKKLKIGFTSPYLAVVPKSVKSLDYSSDISVISVDVQVDPHAPNGDYTVFASNSAGMKRYIVGGVTIEDFANPYSKFSLTDE
jgi:hypothetical protein